MRFLIKRWHLHGCLGYQVYGRSLTLDTVKFHFRSIATNLRFIMCPKNRTETLARKKKNYIPFCIYIYIIYLFIFSIYLSIYFFSHLFIYIDRIFWDDFLHKNTSSRFIWRAEFPTRFSQWCFFVPLLIGPRLEPQIGGAKRFLKIGSTEGIYIYIQTKGDKTKIRL